MHDVGGRPMVSDMNQQDNVSRQSLGVAGGQDVPADAARPEVPGEDGKDHQSNLQRSGTGEFDLLRTWDGEASLTSRVHLSRTARLRLVRAWREARAREARRGADAGGESDRLIA